jgi:Fasciclin domain
MQGAHLMRSILSSSLPVGLVIMGTAQNGHAQGKDIVETAAAGGTFNTLVTAVQTAGLVDTLKGAGPYTVFAPTDEAFAKLPAGTVEGLLRPENEAKLRTCVMVPRFGFPSSMKRCPLYSAGNRWSDLAIALTKTFS